MALRIERTYRPDSFDYAQRGAIGVGLRALRKVRTEAQILTPCPPRNRCHVCETRLDEVFGSNADKTAKYRHQSREAAQAAIHAIRNGDSDVAALLARRAATYALMVVSA